MLCTAQKLYIKLGPGPFAPDGDIPPQTHASTWKFKEIDCDIC